MWLSAYREALVQVQLAVEKQQVQALAVSTLPCLHQCCQG